MSAIPELSADAQSREAGRVGGGRDQPVDGAVQPGQGRRQRVRAAQHRGHRLRGAGLASPFSPSSSRRFCSLVSSRCFPFSSSLSPPLCLPSRISRQRGAARCDAGVRGCSDLQERGAEAGAHRQPAVEGDGGRIRPAGVQGGAARPDWKLPRGDRR
eukprot:3933993-Rhodomonas_salina.6